MVAVLLAAALHVGADVLLVVRCAAILGVAEVGEHVVLMAAIPRVQGVWVLVVHVAANMHMGGDRLLVVWLATILCVQGVQVLLTEVAAAVSVGRARELWVQVAGVPTWGVWGMRALLPVAVPQRGARMLAVSTMAAWLLLEAAIPHSRVVSMMAAWPLLKAAISYTGSYTGVVVVARDWCSCRVRWQAAVHLANMGICDLV